MFDRVRQITRRWDGLPVGPWRVEEAGGRHLVRDRHGRILAECADRIVANALAAAYEDVAHLTGEISKLRRALKSSEESGENFLGKAHDGRITLATITLAPPDDDPEGSEGQS